MNFLQNILDHRVANKENIERSSITFAESWAENFSHMATISGPKHWQVEDWLEDQDFEYAVKRRPNAGAKRYYGYDEPDVTYVFFSDVSVAMLMKLIWTV